MKSSIPTHLEYSGTDEFLNPFSLHRGTLYLPERDINEDACLPRNTDRISGMNNKEQVIENH